MKTALCWPALDGAAPPDNEACAKNGFVAWWLDGGRADPSNPGNRAEIEKRFGATGLPVAGVYGLLGAPGAGGWLAGDAAMARSVRSVKDWAKWCSDLGGETLTLGSHESRSLRGIRPADARLLFVDFIEAVLPILESRRVTLALDPCSSPAGEGHLFTHAEIIEVVGVIRHPFVRAAIGTAAVTDPVKEAAFVEENLPYFVVAHVCEETRGGAPPPHHRLAPVLSHARPWPWLVAHPPGEAGVARAGKLLAVYRKARGAGPAKAV